MTITVSASGARDLWQLVDAPCVQELGGAANGAPVRDLPLPMPEYLHPGVYLDEVPFEARPIDGVPTSTADPPAPAGRDLHPLATAAMRRFGGA